MPVIDFKEISLANVGDGKQDTFELFARDFLQAIGFEIEEPPSRGADGGKDLVVLEPLEGITGITKRRWLVSCKHFAHSGKSVSDIDEPDVLGRTRKFHAEGFMGFYSTLPSSEFSRTLQSHKGEIAQHTWDKEAIESHILNNGQLSTLFERYFPKSYKNWRATNSDPARVFEEYSPLLCAVCGKDLLPERNGNVVLVARYDKDMNREILDMYWACVGTCDPAIERLFDDVPGVLTPWESLADLSIPMVYIRWVIAAMNNLRDGTTTYTDIAFDKFRDFTMIMAQAVVRETSPSQWSRLYWLAHLPAAMGGIGTNA